MASPAGRALIGPESSWTNQAGPMTSSGQAQGFYQITTGTWNDFAPRAGVDLRQYPTPMSAPFAVQQQVADAIPLGRWETKDALKRQYPWATDNMTLSQINRFAGGAGTLVEPEPREPSQWGKPGTDWFNGQPGMMPKPDQGFAGMLMKFAVPLLGIASLASGGGLTVALTAYGAMKKAERDGEILPYIQNKQKWEASLAAHTAQQQMESMDAGEAMSVYADNPDGLTRAMTGIANKYQDRPLMAAIDQGPDAIKRLQARRDMLSQPLMKTQLAIAKMQLDQARNDAAQRLREANYNLSVDRNNLARQKEQREAAAQAAAAAEKVREFNEQHGSGDIWQAPEYGAEAPKPPATAPTPPTTTPPATTAPAPQPPDQPSPEVTPPTTAPPIAGQPDTSSPDNPPENAAGSPAPGALFSDPPDTGEQTRATPTPSVQVASVATDIIPDPGYTRLAQLQNQAQGAPQQPPVSPYRPKPMGPDQPFTLDPEPILGGKAFSQPIKDAGKWLFEGGEPTPNMNKAAVNQADLYRLYLQHQADRALMEYQALPENQRNPQMLMEALRKVDPNYANYLEDVKDNIRQVSTSGGMSARMQAFNTNATALVHRMFPQWNPHQTASIGDFMKPNGRVDLTIGRMNTMTDSIREVADALQNIDPRQSKLSLQWSDYFQGKIQGDPHQTALFNAYYKFNQEANTIIRGTGESVTEVQRQMDPTQMGSVPLYATPAEYRAAMKVEARISLSRLAGLKREWDRLGGYKDGPASFNQDKLDELNALVNMDTQTGIIMNPKTGQPAGVGDDDSLPPGLADYQTHQIQIDKALRNPNDASSQLILRQQFGAAASPYPPRPQGQP